MNRGVIILAPPWPRSGSGNLFAAQAAAHARRGARVFLLLTPPGRGFSRHKEALWQDAVSSMKYPGVDTVSYPRTGRGQVRGYLQWLRAGCDDSLAITARYGTSGRMPSDLTPFLAATRVELIHANHVFSMPLARRVAGMMQRRQGRRPRIVLDTHDVQSKALAVRQKKNPFSRRFDSHDALVRTELALCAQADALVHVTQADCDFFATHLPDRPHAVVLPTLDPASEAELVRRRGLTRTGGPGFIYIGTEHEANLATVRWLLTEVLPLAASEVAGQVRIVGAVGGLLSRRDPPLYRRHASLFAGEVPSVFDYYSGAQAVLAPATAGTGTSIKLIEALCVGKPVLTTSLGLRGLPAGEMTGADIEVHDTPAGFAAALTRSAAAGASSPALSRANAALYDRLFSNARYFADLDRVQASVRSMTREQSELADYDPMNNEAELSGQVRKILLGAYGAIETHGREVLFAMKGKALPPRPPRGRPTKLVARLRALVRHPLSSERRKACREQLRLPVFATPLTDAERPVVLPMDVPRVELAAMVRRRLTPQTDGAISPAVSIVIPVHNQLDFTLRCLISIAQHPSRASVEIVVCDDASDDDTPGVLAALPGIRYVRNEGNLGFLHSCNRAAREARGAHLLFLNNDTQVQEGWLDAMLALFGADARIGLVGAKLLFPDGRLQEAGGIVWRDASADNHGRYDDPRRPEYNHVREVDYCSGACLMIDAGLFRALGGFDVRYAPAYYEDTDLAFRVREAGRKVLYQPKAVVVHHEGVSNGTDIRTGIKACLVANQAKFRERWRKELEDFHMPKPH